MSEYATPHPYVIVFPIRKEWDAWGVCTPTGTPLARMVPFNYAMAAAELSAPVIRIRAGERTDMSAGS